MRRQIIETTFLALLVTGTSMAQSTGEKFIPLTETEKLVCETMLEGVELNEFSETEARKEYQALVRRWESEKADFAGRVNTQIGNSSVGFTGHGTDFLNQSEKIRKGLLVDIDKRQALDSHNEQHMNPDFKDFVRNSKSALDRKISEQKDQLKALFVSNFNSYYLNTATEQNKKIKSDELWSPVNTTPSINGQQVVMTAQTTDAGIPFQRIAALDLTNMTLTLETKRESEGADGFKFVSTFSLRDRSNVQSKTVSGDNEVVISNGKAVSPEKFITMARDRHQKSLYQTIVMSGSGLSENSRKALNRCATHRLTANMNKMRSESLSKEVSEQSASGEVQKSGGGAIKGK
jgi:hypothetical protein